MIIESDFKPAWWLPGPHLQTVWPLVRRRNNMPTRRERLELPDGDFLDLDWTLRGDGPLVIVLHGLEGSIRSHYAGAIMQALDMHGMRSVLMHFRGCSGEPNRLARSYHSGETGDLEFVLQLLRGRYPDAPMAAVGYSLGGNVLLKYLGERGADCVLQAAAAVSVPFDLHNAARRLERGVSRIYQWQLLRRLRGSIRMKFNMRSAPVALDDLDSLDTFRRFDDRVTAPLHGFRDVDDYYTRSSSRQYLQHIRIPTYILHSRDDPFMSPDAVPGETDLAEAVTLEISAGGGHVGFVYGNLPWRAGYLPDSAVPGFLSKHLLQGKSS
jgi:predicted alpha/beta-fold hydrolase